MKTKTIGLIAIVIGIIMMVFTSINFKTKEEVVDLGALEINKEKNHPVKWSPIIGAVLIIGGIVVVATAKKSS
jgi:drug/metabolite transporter (DMT)-like permease